MRSRESAPLEREEKVLDMYSRGRVILVLAPSKWMMGLCQRWILGGALTTFTLRRAMHSKMTFQTLSPVMLAYRGKHATGIGREFRSLGRYRPSILR